MSLATLLNRNCTIVRRLESATVDESGDAVPDEELVETTCELQQRQRSEDEQEGETSDTGWLLILPAGTEIGTGDMVIVDNREYEMVGDPWAARNPRTQAESHVEASVRMLVGSWDES